MLVLIFGQIQFVDNIGFWIMISLIIIQTIAVIVYACTGITELFYALFDYQKPPPQPPQIVSIQNSIQNSVNIQLYQENKCYNYFANNNTNKKYQVKNENLVRKESIQEK